MSDYLTDGRNISLVTEKTMSAVWMLYCKEKYDALNGCHSNSYRGPLTLQGFASFVKLLSQPRVVSMSLCTCLGQWQIVSTGSLLFVLCNTCTMQSESQHDNFRRYPIGDRERVSRGSNLLSKQE